jgi:hypothetical protein
MMAAIFGIRGRPVVSAFCAVALSFALSACVQSTGASTGSGGPTVAAGAVATSEPVVLSGAAYTDADPMTTSSVTAAPRSTTDIVPVPASAPGVTTATISSSKPPVAASSSPAATPSTVQSSAPAIVSADEYPNVNITPPQPDGKLLTPEERAKLIAELNALAARQTGGQ